ncbi:MAG: glycoside hydrolase family 43 protein [Catalinimonas sp.]
MRIFFFLLLAAGVARAGWAQTYTNPVGDSLYVADPFVLRHEGTYYLYGTTAHNGFRAWTSDNLVDWQPKGFVYRRRDSSWAKESFWAPEVVHYQDKFYLIFSAKGSDPDGFRLCLAVADDPAGPFEDLRTPWFDWGYSCIDGHLYLFEGRPYLYYEMVGVVGEPWRDAGYFKGTILGCELSADLSRVVSNDPVLCVAPGQPWEMPPGGKARSTEGMTVFEHGDSLYMTYSANHYTDARYGVGYATANHPLGPWTKSTHNPILAQDPARGVSGPGHNGVIRSPDGTEWFIVYHSHADVEHPTYRRILNIARLVVEPDGRLRVVGPTRTPQPRPSGADR